ncbi:MAG: ABC transporter permease [Rubrobacteraceae bacterium]
MGSSFSAEVLKLRKRKASWVLVLVLILLVAVTGYAALYFSIQDTTPPGDLSAEEQQAFEDSMSELNKEFLQVLLPKKVLVNVLSSLSRGGGIVALIFGALAFGSEYSWGTLKTVLSRRPGKSKMFTGKVLAMLAYFAVFSVLVLVTGGICSYFIAGLENEPVRWPSVWNTIKALGAGWLIFAVWGTLGAFLATLFRSSSLAIGLGLGYAIVIEQTAVSFSASVQNNTFQSVLNALPGTNSTALAEAFGKVPEGFSTGVGEAIEPTQAVAVLGAYTVILVLFTVLLFWRRDVDGS